MGGWFTWYSGYSTTCSQNIWGRGSYEGYHGFTISNGNIGFYFRDSLDNQVSCGITPVSGVSYHLIVSVDWGAKTLKFYQDGVLKYTYDLTSFTGTFDTGDFTTKSTAIASGSPPLGIIDRLHIVTGKQIGRAHV